MEIVRIALNGSAELAVKPSIEGVSTQLGAAVEAGFSGYWLAQTGLTDALTVLVATAAQRGDLEVGTAVIPTFPRHPTALAAQALTAQAALGGRLVLGIGLSHQPTVEGSWHLAWDRPLRHMRDYLDVLLPLLDEGQVSHRGDLWGADVSAVRPTEAPPSVMLAALGPQMLELAGSRTDGTILWLVGPRTIREHIAPRLGEAASAAGRQAPRVVCSLPVCVTDDADSARALIGQVLAGYDELPSYRAMLDREDAAGPADVAVVGDEKEVDAALDELADAGVTDFAALPFTFDPELTARTWALLGERARR
ncbi:MAG: TIGR03564 family F420-dependent LLM class oxidoreductase [Actinomycetota bacterium]|nr:TIGR03564 family F420-dependent LLM class oxidoreductase [Actinomycetota bacterium]